MRKLSVVLLLLCFLAGQMRPAGAITVCFDYVLYRVTGQGENQNRMSAAQLKDRLTKMGYKRFPFSTAAENSNASRLLRPGYVIFLGDAHVGYVVEGGRIDHFLQVYGKSGTPYDPGHLPPNLEGTKGGLYRGATLQEFIHCGFSSNPQPVEVWRR